MCVLNITEQCCIMFPGIKYLNETNVIELISKRNGPDPYRDNNELLCTLYQIFSTPEALGNSFVKPRQCYKKNLLKQYNHAKTSSQTMTKEEVSLFYTNLTILYV